MASTPSHKVVILGGGIAGLSAAHELIERHFEVEIHELRPIAGGKARSFPLPGSGTNGRKDLPGEHGFRFFPRFYRHVTDTMSRIPFGAHGTVADNLVDTTVCQLARFGRQPVNLPARSPRTMNDVRLALDDLRQCLGGDLGLSHDELAFFVSKVWQIVTSCRDRRMNEYEKLGWWDFIEAEQFSSAYQKLLGHGITRSLVAAKARTASTKTIGDIFVQLLFDIATPGPSTDRVLNGPTNDVWIDPWLELPEVEGGSVPLRLEGHGSGVRWRTDPRRNHRPARVDAERERRLFHLRDADRRRDRSRHSRDDQGGSGAGASVRAGSTSPNG